MGGLASLLVAQWTLSVIDCAAAAPTAVDTMHFTIGPSVMLLPADWACYRAACV
jgi:hypothetical protein